MKPALEDIFMGPTASPSLSVGFRWEDSRRRVRVVFADVTVAASERVMLLLEFGRLPVFYFPMEDVRMDLMEATEHHTYSPLKGEASYWSVRVGNRVAENAAWGYPNPLPEGPSLKGYLALYWDQMDAWYEEGLTPYPLEGDVLANWERASSGCCKTIQGLTSLSQ